MNQIDTSRWVAHIALMRVMLSDHAPMRIACEVYDKDQDMRSIYTAESLVDLPSFLADVVQKWMSDDELKSLIQFVGTELTRREAMRSEPH